MKILVTGSTDGIGLATAEALAALGRNVIVHGRNDERVAAAVRDVRAAGSAAVDGTARSDADGATAPRGGSVDGIVGDLSSLAATDHLAEEVAERFPDVGVLINNAGVVLANRQSSPDGYELTLAVNHLAHMLLTLRLLPLLRRNASGTGLQSRVVNVASMVHEYNGINWDDLHFLGRYDGQSAYGQSKVANVMFTRILAARLAEAGRFDSENGATPDVAVNALHPGVIDTKLLHVFYGGGASTASGAETSVYLAIDPAVKRATGKYYSDSRETRSWVLDDPPEESLRLWNASVEMIEAVVGAGLEAAAGIG